MNGDLISRSALLAAYDKAHQGPPGGARKLIEDAPEALVRCKECKHGSLYCTEDVCGETLIECNRPELGDVIEIHGWNWFCADGERRPAP